MSEETAAPDWLAIGGEYSREARLRQQRTEADEWRQRMFDRKAGKKVRLPILAAREKPRLEGKIHLVVGDAHFHPGDPCPHRAAWLGRMITDLQPDVVIDGGDWWSMDSLCAYETKGSQRFEGKRYYKDLEAGILAQERLRAQLDEYNRGRRAKDRIAPRFVRILGNHEYRIERVIEDEPKFDAMIGMSDLLSAEFGWEEQPFLEPLTIDGVSYCHYFDKGGRAPGYATKHLAANTLAYQHRTSVFFHTHRFDYFEEPVGDTMIQVVNAGAYFEHWEHWAGADNRRWRRGLLILRNVAPGRPFDFEWIGMKAIEARYS